MSKILAIGVIALALWLSAPGIASLWRSRCTPVSEDEDEDEEHEIL